MGHDQHFNNLVITTTMGGIASRATGGSFQDGAISAATVYLFNDWINNKPIKTQNVKILPIEPETMVINEPVFNENIDLDIPNSLGIKGTKGWNVLLDIAEEIIDYKYVDQYNVKYEMYQKHRLFIYSATEYTPETGYLRTVKTEKWEPFGPKIKGDKIDRTYIGRRLR